MSQTFLETSYKMEQYFSVWDWRFVNLLQRHDFVSSSCSLLPAHFPSSASRVQNAVLWQMLPFYSGHVYTAPNFCPDSHVHGHSFLFWLAPGVYIILFSWYLLSYHRWDPIVQTTGRNDAEMSCLVAHLVWGVAYCRFCYFSKSEQKIYPHLNYIYEDNIFWNKTLNIWSVKRFFLCDL